MPLICQSPALLRDGGRCIGPRRREHRCGRIGPACASVAPTAGSRSRYRRARREGGRERCHRVSGHPDLRNPKQGVLVAVHNFNVSPAIATAGSDLRSTLLSLNTTAVRAGRVPYG